MSKENEVFIKAANNIFIALINIWSNEITQKHQVHRNFQIHQKNLRLFQIDFFLD